MQSIRNHREPSDRISAELARTLPGLFSERLRRTADKTAYLEFDRGADCWRDYTWGNVQTRAAQLQMAIEHAGLKAGERVAILLPNCIDWVSFDMAALGLGLVVIPLYAHDSAANVSFILGHSDSRLLLLDTLDRWRMLSERRKDFPLLSAVWISEAGARLNDLAATPVVRRLKDVLPLPGGASFKQACNPRSLATIIYTSGTTGRPKGTMLSHFALLWNAEGVAKFIPPRDDDIFLSHLPLAHAFERTVGYYLPMIGGAMVAYARSIDELSEDLKAIRPTVFLSVPRIYERVYGAIRGKSEGSLLRRRLASLAQHFGWRRFEAAQGRDTPPGYSARLIWTLLDCLVARPIRAAFGGRLRVAVSGGAPLPEEVIRFLVAMGLPLVEGYGLTEAGPVVTATALNDNLPGSVGRALPGIELAVAENNELLVHSPAAMTGYWKDEARTSQAIDRNGWLHTGDLAEIENGRLFICGRLQDIQVLAIGEKVNASLIEDEITQDRLFEQALVIGEGKPFLAAVCVLNRKRWLALASTLGVGADDPNVGPVIEEVLLRLRIRLKDQPRYAQVQVVHLVLEPWTLEAGLLTPSLKVKRDRVEELYRGAIEALFAGHPIFR
jgi:long-chain acyl-CoA synthetase